MQGAQGATVASLGTAPSAPASYAVRCVGLCGEESVPHLHNLLKSMCVRRTVHEENEYGMSMPLQSNSKQGSYKMIKIHPPASQAQMVALSPAPPVTWRLVHESPQLRGAQYNGLPAAVLEVSESALYGMYSVHFLLGLGCSITYRVARHNYVYVCSHDGVEVQVSVFTVHNRTDTGKPQPPLFPGSAVEVRVTVGPEQQIEAARKVGAFCQKLLPLVLCKKG